ncbi:MotA/TolQ/ExbB proton channel family protein [Kordiimonas sp. SCSIO 12603]|uniref:MotA/TolQ/ExbB proton channel family protein n=1 Tax=Kordiimonas sp. SCSIO 12603 TaxID=2829596 RepID=UPI0021070B57|nr:MotA/TolQ/ExbB proton channel family protein [Kordiimonas sp. SCSIO 12603]UTW58455.1 MotA/TolQ/ExbB proton channel family protein [Kordiimonas sp. SCSIO 12603]
MKKIITSAALLAVGLSASVSAQDGSMSDLLNKVREGRVSESAEHKKREAEFQARKGQQQKLLTDARAEQARLERESARLEEQRRNNEQEITRQVEIQRERLGQLSELFGVLQQNAGDAKSIISTSHVSIDNPNRLAEIDNLISKAQESSELPTLSDIRAWPAQMILEMIGSSEVKKFNHEVRLNDGSTQNMEVVRIGDFGLVGDGKYLQLTPKGVVAELQRQPSDRFTGTIAPFENSTSGMHALGIDPTRGQLLNLEIDKPTIEERLDQGGPIGYITLGLGVIGVIIAILQWLYLLVVGGKVRKQIRSETADTGNPLGRVLAVYDQNRSVDVETLELKLDEAILKETPALERGLTIVKLISAVAPLFGLLGTVTGMIETFQAITLFGAGDPSQMAGGISAALMTTVEGLVVAIPTLLLHTFVSGSSKSVIHVLEEQSAGIIAVHAEKANG